jgi:putative heme-binding domain-containing protein
MPLLIMRRLPGNRRALRRLLLAIAVTNAIAPSVFAQPTSSRATIPRAAAVWASGPLDVVAAFDTAVDPVTALAFVGKSIPYFEPEGSAGGRAQEPRRSGSLRIVGARLTDAGRTLTLATDPHPRLATYLLPMSEVAGDAAAKASYAASSGYDLAGVEATWAPDNGPDAQPLWTGWWPRLDLEATRRLTRGSRRHEEGLALLAKPGRLTLGSLVQLPEGTITLRIESSQPIEEAILGDAQAELSGPEATAEHHHALLKVQSQRDPLFLSIICRTAANGRPFTLAASYRAGDAKADHDLERGQTILPWAPVPVAGAIAPLVVPDLSGGDAVRGKAVFNGEQARCSQCHAFRGRGQEGKIGPDLTEIGKKGRAEIYRAIAAPSATIEADFTSYSVATTSGQVVVGIVRAEGPDTIRITDTNAHATLIPRKEIEQIRPSANSIMPVGLTGALGDAAVRDLIAYLTAPSTIPR